MAVIDERECARKFCPFGRGAVQVPSGDPLKPDRNVGVGGVNFIPASFITHCWGSRCMLWEEASRTESQKCHTCEGDPAKDMARCKSCNGTGKTEKPYTVVKGYCGAGAKPTGEAK